MGNRIYTKKTLIDVPVETLFAWHEQPGAIERLTPPWAPMEVLSRQGDGVKKGVKVSFRLKILNIPRVWNAEHVAYEKNAMFRDVQTKGPFTQWIHTHRFIPNDDRSSFMEDHVEFKLPMGILSRPFYGYARREFNRMFTYRHQVLKYDLEHHINRHRKLNILISGASGTIGSILVPFLRTCGHRVIQLVRHPSDPPAGNPGLDQVFWDPYQEEIDAKTLPRIDAVINLNGVDISRGRWTERQKKRIIDSRVIPTRFLVKLMSQMADRPEVFISSSAIGFYGDRSDEELSEDQGQGDCFISDVCRDWEAASLPAEDLGIRTVRLRIGIVLTPAGGALERMAPAFRLGCGVRLSHGKQYMSWISMEDTLSGILHILNHKKIDGPVNLTAPHPVTNREFSNQLARIFSKKAFFVMPEWVSSLLWGQMGRETLLASARVPPSKLQASGFRFRHESLESALKTTLGR